SDAEPTISHAGGWQKEVWVARSCSAVPPNERLAWLWRACGRACVARACLPWGRGSWHCEWDFGRGIRASHVGGGPSPTVDVGVTGAMASCTHAHGRTR